MTDKNKSQKLAPLMPYLTAKDLRKSSEFYQKAFGFKLEEFREDNGVGVHAEMTFADARILLGAEGAFGSDKQAPVSSQQSIPLSLWLYCSDVDALYKRGIAAGAVSLMEPNDAEWGHRVCMFRDVDGYEWGFCRPL